MANPAAAISDSRMQTTARSLGDAAYQTIRRAIIRCDLVPGDRVSGPQLAEQYGLGPAAVREALNRLEQEKLVRAIRRAGYVIAPVSLKYVNDLFQTRSIIESACAALATGRVDIAELEALEEVCRSPYRLDDRVSVEQGMDANAALHLTIARATGNDRLVDTVAGIHDEMERLQHLGHILRDQNQMANHDHRALIDALAAGDSDRAATEMRAQIEETRRWILDVLIDSPAMQALNVAGR